MEKLAVAARIAPALTAALTAVVIAAFAALTAAAILAAAVHGTAMWAISIAPLLSRPAGFTVRPLLRRLLLLRCVFCQKRAPP
ncbi:hypothetical protein TAMA11512_19940 [Selenomonas sp. TAMA-11512]|nr:hypothetical protein TAMA11512_19940 [Selenomonas sp. TAMA-11512]